MAQDLNNQNESSSLSVTKLMLPKITKLNSLDSKNQEIPNLEGKTLLAQYRITQKFDKNSGEANLYRGYDIKSNQELIVKQYRRKEAIKPDVISKLQSLNSNNVVKILAYGEEQGFPFVVEPYYDGNTLREYINGGFHFSLEQLRSIIANLNEILKTIHSHDLIHKDLKPDNIMLIDHGSYQEFILIDFGISTETNGRTVVVTQTGSTPYYAAPETNNGAYSIYSDYYSLGITIYEIYTGYTPFQSNALNHSDVALYAQMQKIPYPDDFPQELKDLIDGLTYKDLSNRNDLNNPNRRWTYDEVTKWLKGEKQIVPGMGIIGNASKGDYQIPYFFNGKQLYNLIDIANEYYANYDEAIKEIGRGFLGRYFEQVNDEIRKKFVEQTEKEITSSTLVDPYAILIKLLYQITPNLKQILWKNKKFDSLTDYANTLIDDVVNNSSIAQDFITTAKTWLELDVLVTYVNNQIDDLNIKQSLLSVLNNNKELIKAVPLNEINQALRLGYSLTNREDFKIGSLSFKSIDEFNEFFDKLYNDNIEEYVNFFHSHQNELTIHEKLLVGGSNNKFRKHLTQNERTIVLLDGEYIFRKPLDVLNYLLDLYNKNQLMLFYSFIKRTYQEFTTSDRFINADKEKYNQIINSYKELIVIDEHIFKNLNDLKAYATTLKKYKLSLLERFIDLHHDVLNLYENSSNSINKNVLTELRKILTLGINKVIKQENDTYIDISKKIRKGDIVKFGSYYQNDNQRKEPIEWIVLDKKDNQALLISKYALDCKPYHSVNTDITWEDSFLRNWCNGYFLETAFKEKERDLIQVTNNENDVGSKTQDKIFLLSKEEVEANSYNLMYFRYSKDRACKPTQFAIANGVWQNNIYHCCWWLRSQGLYGNRATYVSGEGGYDDRIVSSVNFAVRPVLYIKLT